MHIRALQNATKFEIDLGQCIFLLDLLHRSQNALIEVSIGAKERGGERKRERDRKGRREREEESNK